MRQATHSSTPVAQAFTCPDAGGSLCAVVHAPSGPSHRPRASIAVLPPFFAFRFSRSAMTPIHLVILWHMHQPQYRDPASGRFLLPWTRLHALKDYYGMAKLVEEFPALHATFNIVPALGHQLEEYASGVFQEVWL